MSLNARSTKCQLLAETVALIGPPPHVPSRENTAQWDVCDHAFSQLHPHLLFREHSGGLSIRKETEAGGELLKRLRARIGGMTGSEGSLCPWQMSGSTDNPKMFKKQLWHVGSVQTL